MNKNVVRVVTTLALAMMAAPAFAQDAVANETSTSGLKFIAAGLAIGLAAMGGTLGQGRAASAAYEGIGRNPQSADKMFTPLLLGLALIEFQTIMAFIIAFLLIGA